MAASESVVIPFCSFAMLAVMSRIIPNRQARRLFLQAQGLASQPTGKLTRQSLYEMIENLGFVQVDTVNAVCRAHHHILHARNQGYRERMLAPLLERERRLFEHWTHDASIIPTLWYPHWHHRFDRLRKKYETSKNWAERIGTPETVEEVRRHIEAEGRVSSADFADRSERTGPWWGWSRHKAALEYLWFTGELSIAGREGFRKIYDLTERVIPEEVRAAGRSDEVEHVEWACRTALDRLVIATHGELASFWEAIGPEEAKAWCAAELGKSIVPVQIEGEDGKLRNAFAPTDIEARLEAVVDPPSRIRLINPFDPAIRDRKRLKHLFGFDYRIEIFVPAAKRQYGYYVFPLLEGDRFIGRMDLKADRKSGSLNVQGLWLEPRVKLGKDRLAKLEAELDRCARFAGLERVEPGDHLTR